MYVKDGTIYPVAMTKEQVDAFEIAQRLLPQPINVIGNKPIGKAVDLVNGNEGA